MNVKNKNLRKKISLCWLAATCSFLNLSEGSAHERSFYFKSGAGYNFASGKVKTESQRILQKNFTPYGNVLMGESNNSATFSGTSVNLGFGYNVSNNWRTDLMFNYNFEQQRRFNFKEGSFFQPNGGKGKATDDANIFHRSWMIKLNLYYDFDEIGKSNITPFIKAGVGYASVENFAHFYPLHNNDYNHLFIPEYSKHRASISYDLGVGASYLLSKGIYVDLGYKINWMKSRSLMTRRSIKYPPIHQDKYTADIYTADIKVKTPDFSHSINLDFRFEF